MSQTYLTVQGDTADYIAWKQYGSRSDRVTEQLLEANPGLAGYGPTLPAGVLVTLPDIPLEVQQASRVVRLWD